MLGTVANIPIHFSTSSSQTSLQHNLPPEHTLQLNPYSDLRAFPTSVFHSQEHPYVQLPHNMKFLHAGTIGRYLARKAHLYPMDNDLDACLSDEYVEMISECLQHSNVDVTRKLLHYFESILIPERDACLVGGKISWADLYLWCLIDREYKKFLSLHENTSLHTQSPVKEGPSTFVQTPTLQSTEPHATEVIDFTTLDNVRMVHLIVPKRLGNKEFR
ncbi:hypothetical protein C9374_005793 [Naegleria lovaniensis]|uniref:Glutathione S-transferase C-terminal domain-containing protein n=1 Tax=Naegleria lovaniensis TaxID=51637 RepID=A0AA88GMN3_NAELO|nr:uncharacterized protein C9374_005793 [Naegleria lovaniensis]KAG2382001.1 hypothetical protein C9374_005793 [Naegleria lovaniensis]